MLSLAELLEEKDLFGEGGGKIFKLTRPAGEYQRYVIRILPRPGEENPFITARVFYFKNEAGESVPGTIPGDKNIAAAIYFALRKADISSGAKSVLRNIAPNEKTFFNIVDRSDGDIKVWSAPYGAARAVREQIEVAAMDNVDVTHPEDGRDLVLRVVPNLDSYKVDTVSVKSIPSPIGIEDWEDKLIDLEEFANQRVYDDPEEIEALVKSSLGDFYDELYGVIESLE